MVLFDCSAECDVGIDETRKKGRETIKKVAGGRISGRAYSGTFSVLVYIITICF